MFQQNPYLGIFGQTDTPLRPRSLGVLHSLTEQGAEVSSSICSGSLLAAALGLFSVACQLLLRLALPLFPTLALLVRCPFGLLSRTLTVRDMEFIDV